MLTEALALGRGDQDRARAARLRERELRQAGKAGRGDVLRGGRAVPPRERGESPQNVTFSCMQPQWERSGAR
ncbi:MAG: hypothetical protein ACLR4Z_14620 [Butyricicoccaceae bacterium]